MKRDKPFRTISELIALLKSRELHIEDEKFSTGDFFIKSIITVSQDMQENSKSILRMVMINSLKGSHSNIFGS